MAARSKEFTLYGFVWKSDQNPVAREVYMIQHGGRWRNAEGDMVGEGLFFHYKQLQSLLWPDDDHNEWSDLILQTILDERITVIQGPKDSGKTRTMAKYALTDYFCFPHETLTLLSSTDIRGLELRIWGALKDLLACARLVWPNAPGFPLDSLHGIFTDGLDDNNDLRDIRKGLICIPCLESNGEWKGMEKYTGIKQKRRRLCGDEVQLMQAPYLTALANLDKARQDFKGVFVGNPIGAGDPLDKFGEPPAGWDSLGDITETTTWRNRFGGVTIQLYGPDSPAIKEPGKHTHLIDQDDIDLVVSRFGKDSPLDYNQARGIRPPGGFEDRFFTRDMALRFRAMEPVVWRGKATTKLYGVDAGYGGDRCVGGWAEFGQDVNGEMVLWLSVPHIIPIKLFPRTVPEAQRLPPEDQIAMHVRDDCTGRGIPASHVFHDATGRGSLGTSFARLWSADTTPLEFGGSPAARPVCSDLFKTDDDTGQKRLIRCDEYFLNRVTQYWYTVRLIVEGRQLRGLSEDVLDELCARKLVPSVRSERKQIEPKDKMKLRFGRSPDLADWCAIICEGAIRLGFRLARLEGQEAEEEVDTQWRDDLRQRARQFKASFALDYSA